MAKPVDKTVDVNVAFALDQDVTSSQLIQAWVEGVQFTNINGQVLQSFIAATFQNIIQINHLTSMVTWRREGVNGWLVRRPQLQGEQNNHTFVPLRKLGSNLILSHLAINTSSVLHLDK